MDGNFENIELQGFVPDLEAQQRSLQAYLDRQERMSFNEFHERTGGDVAEFGKYIVSLRETLHEGRE